MPATWFGLSPWELAFLADAREGETTVIDALAGPADWLRASEPKALGATVFARRMSRLPPEIDAEIWEPLCLAARLLVLADSAGAVVLRDESEGGISLVTASLRGVAAQVAFQARGVALRPTAWPLEPGELAGDLVSGLADPATTEAVALRWTRASGLVGYSKDAIRLGEDAVSARRSLEPVCAFTLFAAAEPLATIAPRE